jgi:hypothetical protein
MILEFIDLILLGEIRSTDDIIGLGGAINND